MQVIILAATLAKSCTISCKICARLCKNRARKGTYRVHVPSKSCMQDSCTILHDLASSFLLGYACLTVSNTFFTSYFTISDTPWLRIACESPTRVVLQIPGHYSPCYFYNIHCQQCISEHNNHTVNNYWVIPCEINNSQNLTTSNFAYFLKSVFNMSSG